MSEKVTIDKPKSAETTTRKALPSDKPLGRRTIQAKAAATPIIRMPEATSFRSIESRCAAICFFSISFVPLLLAAPRSWSG